MNHSQPSEYPALSWLNVGLRGVMEAVLVLGLGYLGYLMGNQNFWKILLAILMPLVFFGIWGILDFRRLNRYAEPFRLIEELLITLLAAAALYVYGAHFIAWALAILSVVHHSLTYLIGERLLKPQE